MLIRQKINAASAASLYRNYFTQFVILESLVIHGNATLNNLTHRITNRGHGNSFWVGSVNVSYVIDRMHYLQNVGFIDINNETRIIKITNLGLKSLRDGVIQNMVSTAFYNYRTLYYASFALFASIGAAFISVLALFKK